MADLIPTIEQVAGEPAKATIDNQSAEAHPLPELIEADRYLKSQEAVEGTNQNGGKKSGWGCLRSARAVPPGAV